MILCSIPTSVGRVADNNTSVGRVAYCYFVVYLRLPAHALQTGPENFEFLRQGYAHILYSMSLVGRYT